MDSSDSLGRSNNIGVFWQRLAQLSVELDD